MATRPSSPPPPPPIGATSQSPSTLKRTRKATRLRSLATRPVGAERPLVHVNPVTGKAYGPHKKKLRTYLGIFARDKVDVTYENWKQVPTAQKDLIWEDNKTEFDILQASNLRTKKKILQTVPTRKVLTTLYVRPAETLCGRMCEKRHRPSRNKTLSRTCSKDLPHVFLHGSQRPGATNATNQGPAGGVDHRKSDSTANVILQPDVVPGLTLPPEPEVGPSAARISTKESCVDPSGNDPNTGDSNKYELYIEENPPHLVALGRLYKGSITIHNIPLLHDQVKVGVEEVRDADAPIPVPTEEVKLVGQTLNIFLPWPTRLVKRLSEQGAMGPAKPADRPDHDVDDPLYLMTLTIPQVFLML
ncbi:hypothetical protein GmHk_07G019652 [Glycine max]|nr:hypothetical protein GmHk_07G019652 [Glycine max]